MADETLDTQIKTKLVKPATIFLEDLENLSEGELRDELRNQIANIATLKDLDTFSSEQISSLSDFAAVCFSFSNCLAMKCKD